MKTYLPTEKDFDTKTYLVDASGKTLGRLATRVASLLIGKGKTSIAPDRLAGDFVIVINARDIFVTGKKKEQKMYKQYSGYPDGQRTYNFENLIGRKPVEVIERAVERMLPKNRLGAKMLTRLRVFAGAEHNQQSRRAIPLELAS